MLTVKWLPELSPYEPIWEAMRQFTEGRTADTPDEIWLVEHRAVYTLGQAGKPEHILNPGLIPIVHSDRGGQVTYHGPGQLLAYCLIDLRRAGLYVKEYVALLEDVIIQLLNDYGLSGACRKPTAPGVYLPIGINGNTELAKIAALGIKVRNGCTYHGAALNVDMDLAPFEGINPCGYEGLRTTDLAKQGVRKTVLQAGNELAERLTERLEQISARP